MVVAIPSTSTALTCSWLSSVVTASLSKETLRRPGGRGVSVGRLAPGAEGGRDSREAVDDGEVVSNLAALVYGVLLGSAHE